MLGPKEPQQGERFLFWNPMYYDEGIPAHVIGRENERESDGSRITLEMDGHVGIIVRIPVHVRQAPHGGAVHW